MSKNSSNPKSHASVSQLRAESSRAVTRAELDILSQRITDLVIASPQKAATILTDWTNRPSWQRKTGKKVAAATDLAAQNQTANKKKTA